MTQIKRSGFKLPSPGPYIARITSHLDPTFMGGVEAVLEQGTFNDPSQKSRTIPLKYLSPFAGVMASEFQGNDPKKFEDVQKSYGMWMVPPDVGARVFCMFIESDSNQGYWFGCVQDRWQNHMVPGLPVSADIAWGPGQKAKYDGLPVPVGEFLNVGNRQQSITPGTEPKPVHPFADRLLAQGLLSDKYRGVTTSGARRESPSAVFGISTPGPVSVKGPKKWVGYEEQYQVPISRLSGHTFVMDDGDSKGDNQLIRIRSSSGHQILLNDTAGLVYIANGEGTAWIELTKEGKIDVFATDSVSIHTKNDFNFRADRDINFEAVRDINLKSNNNIVMNSNKDFNLRVTNDSKIFVDGKSEQFVRTAYNLTVADEYNLYATGQVNVTSGGTGQSGGGINMTSFNSDYKVKASTIHHNGDAGPQASIASDALNKTLSLQQYENPSTDPSAGWPARYSNGKIVSILKRVPMHEPWVLHESYDPSKVTPGNTDVKPPPTSTPAQQAEANTAPVPPVPNRDKDLPKWYEDDEWIRSVKALATKLNCDWLDLMAIMYLESAKTMSPSIKNPKSSATGLIQFIEKTAKGLGTSTSALANMTRVQQMPYVEQYFMKSGITSVKNPGINDLYMAVFAPVGVNKKDDFVLYRSGTDAYRDNNQYDSNGDGTITKGEASQALPVFKAQVKAKLGLK